MSDIASQEPDKNPFINFLAFRILNEIKNIWLRVEWCIVPTATKMSLSGQRKWLQDQHALIK